MKKLVVGCWLLAVSAAGTVMAAPCAISTWTDIRFTTGTNCLAVLPLKPVGTLRHKSAAEVGEAGWVICGGGPERGFSFWSEYRDYIAPLGIAAYRVQANWARTEQKAGEFDFAWIDEVVDYCAANGIRPILELSYGNPIHPNGGGATLRGKFPSGEGLKLWDDWVDRITKRYRGRVQDWAGWNEPDIRNANAIEDIAAFCARTAKIIRRNIPDAHIAGLSLAQCNPDYIERLLELTGRENLKLYDSFVYHGYVYNPESVYPRVEGVRLALAKYAPHVRLWQGENGAPSEWNGVGAIGKHDWSEISQAKWDLRRMLGDKARGIRCSLFCITDFLRPGTDEQNHKGLLRISDARKTTGVKLAYSSVQNLVSVFDSKVRKLPEALWCERNSIEKFAFTREGHPIFVFWDAGDRENTVPSGTLQSRPMTLYWAKGRPLADPVWVDLLSGRVYEYPAGRQSVTPGIVTFTMVPYCDSPCLLTERAALELQ